MADWKRSQDRTRLILRTPIETRGEDLTTVANFTWRKANEFPSC